MSMGVVILEVLSNTLGGTERMLSRKKGRGRGGIRFLLVWVESFSRAEKKS